LVGQAGLVGCGCHLVGVVWYERILRGWRGVRCPPCATTEGGRTVPGRRGQYGRGTRRTDRRSPYAPPHQGSGTTGSATHTHRRGSGNGLRFAFGWVVWYGIILQGQGASAAPVVPVPQAAQARADSITISRTSSIE
jgi:hypothetical protein